ncbi:unnamed protein product [Boreogadus saida]
MPGSFATKVPTTGSEVAAETGNAAAPGLSIRRGEAGGDAPSSSRSESSDSELTRRERALSSGTEKSSAHSAMTAAVSALHCLSSTGSAAQCRHRQSGESAKTACSCPRLPSHTSWPLYGKMNLKRSTTQWAVSRASGSWSQHSMIVEHRTPIPCGPQDTRVRGAEKRYAYSALTRS